MLDKDFPPPSCDWLELCCLIVYDNRIFKNVHTQNGQLADLEERFTKFDREKKCIQSILDEYQRLHP